MIRKRYMSNLAVFSEQQLQEGIKELEHGLLKGIKMNEVIAIREPVVFLLASKERY